MNRRGRALPVPLIDSGRSSPLQDYPYDYMENIPRLHNRDTLVRGFLICLLVAAALFFIRSVSHNLGNPEVSDMHGFRQSQTALSIVALRGGGPIIPYETPVAGYPWAIPFEFPLYQTLCAGASVIFGTPPIATARVVGILAYVGTLGMGAWLLQTVGIARRHAAVFLILALMAPLYLFWSRAVMIETTALFLGVSFLAFAAAWVRSSAESPEENTPVNATFFLAALLSGSLCALTKATTYPPIALLAGLICLAGATRRWRLTRRIPWIFVIGAAFLLLAPVVPTYLWTRFADTVKSQNPVGVALTSQSLKDWNFGTLAQRCEPRTWYLIAYSNVWDTVGGLPIPLIAVPLFAAVSARWRRLGFACFCGYLIGPMIFTNLYRVHNYYACGGGLFLVAAVACVIAGLLEDNRASVGDANSRLRRNWRPVAGIAFLLLCLAFQYRTYRVRYQPAQSSTDRFMPQVVSVVRDTCPADKAILGFGFDWSAELPLYAGRRALMMPGWGEYSTPDTPAARDAIRRLRFDGGGIGVLVLTNEFQKRALAHDPVYSRLVRELGFAPEPIYQDSICAVYAPTVPHRAGNATVKLFPPENR